MKKKKKHPDYGLADQAAGRCPYCLASADMDCDCEKEPPQQGGWEEIYDKKFQSHAIGKLQGMGLGVFHNVGKFRAVKSFIRQLLLKEREEAYKEGYNACLKDFKIKNDYGEKSL